MDFNILYAIQNIRTEWLDTFIVFFTSFIGSYAEVFVALGAVLLLFKKTRKTGLCILLSYGLVYVVGQYGLKDLIARPRPCHLDETIELLVKRPSSYSCPSTHSAWAFAIALSVFLNNKKMGYIVFPFAIFWCFTRMYLFVHFPSDVLLGIILGSILAYIAYKLVDLLYS